MIGMANRSNQVLSKTSAAEERRRDPAYISVCGNGTAWKGERAQWYYRRFQNSKTLTEAVSDLYLSRLWSVSSF
jgi:hypothetical protein